MSKKPYVEVLKEALNQPAIGNCKMSTEEIKLAIVSIGEMLKGPMSNEERLMLVADRSGLRATLKQREAGN